MDGVVEISVMQLGKVYLLLLLVLYVLSKAKIKESKLLFIGSIRMTVQLFLAGIILTEIFKMDKWYFTVIYLMVMITFSSRRIFKLNKYLNVKFKIYIVGSIGLSVIFLIIFFVGYVLKVDVLNPQYTIPISGMIVGSTMNGIMLGLKGFKNTLEKSKLEIKTLINLGVTPKKILKPYVNDAIEMAMIPTLNSMVSIGLITLPGMMTGQILAGTLPITAIMYQISIMIMLCTSVTISIFGSMNLGYKTLFNEKGELFLFDEV